MAFCLRVEDPATVSLLVETAGCTVCFSTRGKGIVGQSLEAGVVRGESDDAAYSIEWGANVQIMAGIYGPGAESGYHITLERNESFDAALAEWKALYTVATSCPS
jgi:hypothetical protein